MPKAQRPQETRHFTHGAGGAMADAATEASPRKEDHLPGSPHAKPATPLMHDEKPDQLAEKEAASEDRERRRASTKRWRGELPRQRSPKRPPHHLQVSCA